MRPPVILSTCRPLQLARPRALPRLAKRFSTSIYADGDLTAVKARFNLIGKSYIVTGGGRGIGYAAARAIAEFGGNVSILDHAPSPVRDFENLSRDFGVKTKYIRTDISQEEGVVKAFEETIVDFGKLDGW